MRLARRSLSSTSTRRVESAVPPLAAAWGSGGAFAGDSFAGRAGGKGDAAAGAGWESCSVSGSVSGALHRAWIDTKVSLGAGDASVLESVEAGEDNAKETYQKALSGPLPSNLADIVRRQAESVQRAHDKVKSLRDAAKAA